MDYRRTTRFRQSIHFQHHSSPFLLIICIDAPESTTNLVPQVLRVDAGKHLFSEGEKNVALFFLLKFLEHFWPGSTLLRGHLALATLSPPEDRSSNFGALGLR